MRGIPCGSALWIGSESVTKINPAPIPIDGVATDAVLLKVEVAVGREDFKKEILASIRRARIEFNAKLFPPRQDLPQRASDCDSCASAQGR